MEKDTPPIDNDGEQPKDNFYHGVISKIFWSNETGVIQSDSGKEVPFIFAFVTLLGAPRQDINFLRPGMRVGFDVGWTSKGLRASTIKIYDLYQDDLVPERNDTRVSVPESRPTLEDHPISRYRPPEMYEVEPPHYHQRRARPRQAAAEKPEADARPQHAEQRRPEPSQRPQESRAEARPQGQGQPRSHNRPDRRPREGEQGRPEARSQGAGPNRQENRQGQESRRAEFRQQGQRRNVPPPPQARATATPPIDGPAQPSDTPLEERARRSRRRRGRR